MHVRFCLLSELIKRLHCCRCWLVRSHVLTAGQNTEFAEIFLICFAVGLGQENTLFILRVYSCNLLSPAFKAFVVISCII